MKILTMRYLVPWHCGKQFYPNCHDTRYTHSTIMLCFKDSNVKIDYILDYFVIVTMTTIYIF